MTDAATKAKRAYMRKWRAENKDKVKAHQQKDWERRAAELEAKESEGDGRCSYSQSDSAEGES